VFLGGASTISSNTFAVAGDFKSEGRLAITTVGMRVARDLWSAGDIIAPAVGAVAVGRDAYLGRDRAGMDTLAAGGTIQTEDFSVPPPCPCDPTFDVAALVAEVRAKNDNVAAGLSPNPFDLGSASGKVALPCGRLSMTSTATYVNNPIDFTNTKRTALFIDGDVTATNDFNFDPGTTGELDVFISGTLLITTASAVGNVLRPSALRLYVGNMFSAGLSTIAAQVYAPNSGVQLSGTTEFYGSLVAKGVAVSGAEHLHFDRAILEAGKTCSAPPPISCDGCDQCPGTLACVAGSCSPCTRDADCCEPLVCSNGACGPLVVPAP
jgi:hypothetical protein